MQEMATAIKEAVAVCSKDEYEYLCIFKPLVAKYLKHYFALLREKGTDLFEGFLALEEKFKSMDSEEGKLVHKFLCELHEMRDQYKAKRTYSLKIRLKNYGLLGG
jgi:hypothetical protein